MKGASAALAVVLAAIGYVAGSAQPPQALVLAPGDGEHRMRRPPPAALSSLAAPFIIKVDRRNGGARDFVMFTEDIPPGQTISPHRHPDTEEILFIHRGSGRAWLDGREARVEAGSTIFMPPNTGVRLTNDGSESLSLVAVFARQGFEAYQRDISVPAGEPARPLSVQELTAIRAKHRRHVVYDAGPSR